MCTTSTGMCHVKLVRYDLGHAQGLHKYSLGLLTPQYSLQSSHVAIYAISRSRTRLHASTLIMTSPRRIHLQWTPHDLSFLRFFPLPLSVFYSIFFVVPSLPGAAFLHDVESCLFLRRAVGFPGYVSTFKDLSWCLINVSVYLPSINRCSQVIGKQGCSCCTTKVTCRSAE